MSRDDETILICAFRYSLGRMTYIVSDCCRWLRERWSLLGPDTRLLIKKELGNAIERDDRWIACHQPGDLSMILGGNMDAKQWRDLHAWIAEQP